jgi:D-alanine transaminase
MDTVYLNGHFIPKEHATISIMDRGFLFGDSVYEVVPVHKGKLIGGLQHFTRLQNSLKNILMNCPFADYDKFSKACYQLLKENERSNEDCSLYFQITRGAEKHRSHRIPDNITPTVIGFCMDAHSKSKEELEQGFKAITYIDLRRYDNFIKSTDLLTNVMLYEKACEQGAIETILIRDDKVLECTASNLFIVKDGIIKTPPLADTILAGITRSLILEFAKEHNIPAQEVDLSEEELVNADEVWVSGSTKEICPIVQLNDKPVGNGKVGEIWRKINSFYQQFKETCV